LKLQQVEVLSEKEMPVKGGKDLCNETAFNLWNMNEILRWEDIFAMTNSKFLASGVLFVVLLMVAFVSSVSAQQIVIDFHSWMAAELEAGGVEILHEAKVIYEEENPHVSVNVVPLPYEETLSQFVVMSAAQDAPDVTLVDVAWLPGLVAMGEIKALDQYLESEVLDEFYPATVGEVTKDGQVFAFPWNPGPNAIVYNKTLLSEAGADPEAYPADFDQLNEAIAKISALGPDIQGIALNMTLETLCADYMHPWIWGFGGEIQDNQGNVIVQQDAMIETLQWVKNLVDEGFMEAGLWIRDIRILFANERVGFMLEGPWIKGILDSLSPKGEAFRDEWIAAPMPVGPAITEQTGYTHPSTHAMIMSRQTENPEEVYKFMKFIATDPRITRPWFNSTGLLPVAKSQITEWEELRDPYNQAFLNQMMYTRIPNAWGPHWGTIGRDFMIAVQEIVMEDADIEAALERLETKIQRTLAE